MAIDLLAQAEHDESAQAILITDDAALADAVARAIETELRSLQRPEAAASWREHGCIILVRDWAEGAALSDRLAPEHLQVMVAEPRALFARIRHAGAAFLGGDCPEALGDYVAGPNHVLPTGRTARFASGLSVYDFLKRTTWVEASARVARRNRPGGRPAGGGGRAAGACTQHRHASGTEPERLTQRGCNIMFRRVNWARSTIGIMDV